MAKKNELTRKQRARKRRRTRRRIIFALEILVLLLLAGGLFLIGKLGKLNISEVNFENIGVNEGVQENETLKGYTTIALVGVDSRDEELKSGTNSDTMIIASINNDTKEVKLVSIYRDTYLRVGEDKEGNGIYDKANSAYCSGGAEQMLTMMNKNLDLNIKNYVTVNFSAVANAVDLLGGIEEELTEDEIVFLNDYCVGTSEATGLSYTELPKVAGVHHLNGVQAVAYARIRYTQGNDFRRAARQRDVIYKIVDKAKSADLATLNKIVDEIFPMIYTNLTKTDILKMGMSMLSYEIADQAGFPFDHLYGGRVEEAMDGLDCILPVTLESNAVRLHEFLYPEEEYTPSDDLVAYSNRIIDRSGFGEESRLDISEDGNLESYREAFREE